MRERFRSLMNSRNSLKNTQDEFGQAKILGDPFQSSGADIKKNKRKNL